MQPPIERHRRAAQAQPPEGIERRSRGRTDLSRRGEGEAPPPQERRKAPRALTAALVGCLVLALASFTATQLMRARLTRIQQEKRAAYQQLVREHPFVEGEVTGWIRQYAEENNLHPAFVASIVLHESSYNPGAESGLGARGLMQLMEGTAQTINDHYLHVENYSFDLMWDPETNLRFGCRYLRYLSRLFGGDPVKVTSAYHAGEGSVRSWLKNPAISPDGVTLPVDNIPDIRTRNYVKGVIPDYAIYDALYFHDFNGPDTAVVDPG